ARLVGQGTLLRRGELRALGARTARQADEFEQIDLQQPANAFKPLQVDAAGGKQALDRRLGDAQPGGEVGVAHAALFQHLFQRTQQVLAFGHEALRGNGGPTRYRILTLPNSLCMFRSLLRASLQANQRSLARDGRPRLRATARAPPAVPRRTRVNAGHRRPRGGWPRNVRALRSRPCPAPTSATSPSNRSITNVWPTSPARSTRTCARSNCALAWRSPTAATCSASPARRTRPSPRPNASCAPCTPRPARKPSTASRSTCA